MFRQGIWWRVLLSLLLVALIIGGGIALFRVAWLQGYQAGIVAAGAAGKSAVPATPFYGFYPYGPFGYGFGFPFFFNPFGLLIGIFFFFLFFALIRGIFFRGWGWRRWGGRYYGRGYGPYGPWEAHHPGEGGPNDPHNTSGFSA